jgi:nanoRNase/pAp phosphatase (c-di-AMP/oligoRNAs hydrolase)
VTPRNGPVVQSFPVGEDDQIMLVTNRGQLIRCPVHDIRIARRQTQGVTVFRVGDDEEVVAVAHLSDLGEDDGGNGGDEATTEGLIDHLRAVEGVQVAGLIREQVPLADGSLVPNRVSLRSRGLIDVSLIARRSAGGGHKQAAGFSHPGSVDDIRDFIVSEVSAQLAESAA